MNDSTQIATIGAAGGRMPVAQEAEAFINSIGSREVAVRRNHADILRSLKELAAMAGERFFYEFPVKSGGKTQMITGPSIKLTDAVLSVYGNCGVDTKVTETPDAWIFAATFVDSERGVVLRRLYRQRKGQRSLGGDAGRNEDAAFQIGQSKAQRNVIYHALSTYCDFAFDEARDGLIAKVAEKPAAYRERCLTRLGEYGVPVERVAKWVGRGPDEWGPADLAKIISALQSISEGVATADEIWGAAAGGPPPAPGGDRAAPPPPPEAKPKAAPPAKGGKKAAAAAPVEATDPKAAPADTPAEIVRLMAKAPTVAMLDALWERAEAMMDGADEKAQGAMIDAYERRLGDLKDGE